MDHYNVLIGIGYHLPADRKSFHKGPAKLHEFFYQNQRFHTELLGDWRFSTRGHGNYCRELEEAVGKGIGAKMITHLISQEEHLHFDPAKVQSFYETEILPKITRVQQRTLPRLAHEFDHQIAQPVRFRLVEEIINAETKH
jgi:hypothetical protein